MKQEGQAVVLIWVIATLAVLNLVLLVVRGK